MDVPQKRSLQARDQMSRPVGWTRQARRQTLRWRRRARALALASAYSLPDLQLLARWGLTPRSPGAREVLVTGRVQRRLLRLGLVGVPGETPNTFFYDGRWGPVTDKAARRLTLCPEERAVRDAARAAHADWSWGEREMRNPHGVPA
jgi:hypothetical protein